MEKIRIMNEEYEIDEMNIEETELKNDVLNVSVKVKTKPKTDKIKLEIKNDR